MKKLLFEINAWLEAIVRFLPGNCGIMIRQIFWTRKFLSCGKMTIGVNCTFVKPSSMEFFGKTMINDECYFNADGGYISVGNGTAFNRGTHINASCGGKIIIGNNCPIGPGVVMRTANHRIDSDETIIQKQGHIIKDIFIESDCWIGANAVILGGVRIKKGAVIGAGAVVTKNIPSMAIAVGVPAKILKYRGKTGDNK